MAEEIKEKENKNETENWDEKKTKKFIPIIIILIVLILLFVGYYTYIYIYKNAARYLDKVSDNVADTISEVIDEFKDLEGKDNSDLDYKIDGNIGFTYDKNKWDIDFYLENSPKNFMTQMGLTIKQNNNHIIGGNIYLQDNQYYLKSSDIYDKLLKITFDNSIFEEDTDNIEQSNNITNYLLLTNMEDLEYFVNKLIEYHFEAIKEGTLVTRPAGIMNKEYIYKLNASDKIQANQRLEELINKDDRLASIIKTYGIEDYNKLVTGEFIVKVNTFTEDVSSINISTSDYDIKIECDGEKYKIIDGTGDYIYLWITDEKISLEYYEKDKLTDNLTIINKDDQVSLNLSGEGYSIGFELKETGDDTAEVSMNLHSEEDSIDASLTANIKEENEKTILEGSCSITSEIEKIDITYNLNSIYGNDLVERIDASTAVDIEELDETEQDKLFTNIYNLLDKFGLLDAFMETNSTY